MTHLKNISLICYTLVAIATLIFGIRFTLSSTLMPYHLDALGTTWDALDANSRVLMLNFMKSYAAGFITTAIAMLIILYIPFLKGDLWAYIAVFAIAMVELSNILFRTLSVQKNTPANPPAAGLVIMLAVVVSSFILSMVSRINSSS